ncbi:MAG: hypothetical protein ACQESG_05190, partial [Nanobdellota archaeon]
SQNNKSEYAPTTAMDLEDEIIELVEGYGPRTYAITLDYLPEMLHVAESPVRAWYDWRESVLATGDEETDSGRLLVCALATQKTSHASYLLDRLTEAANGEIQFHSIADSLLPQVSRLKNDYRSRFSNDILTPLEFPLGDTHVPEARPKVEQFEGYPDLEQLRMTRLFYDPSYERLTQGGIEIGSAQVIYQGKNYTVTGLYTDGDMLYAKTSAGFLGGLSFEEKALNRISHTKVQDSITDSLVASTCRTDAPQFNLERVYSTKRGLVDINKAFVCQHISQEHVKLRNLARQIYIPEYDHIGFELL